MGEPVYERDVPEGSTGCKHARTGQRVGPHDHVPRQWGDGREHVVQGKAQAGALVVVRVQPKLLGEAAQVQTTAAANGSWSVNVSVSSLPFVAFPYVLSAVQVVQGTQSDPTSIEVTVH